MESIEDWQDAPFDVVILAVQMLQQFFLTKSIGDMLESEHKQYENG